ncbi:PilZ domain-containing protein [Desulfovibrio sp. OttesenSCG-928-F07]|nr:PilZ domain-containing protein [Desulfovibrio sp. OttesenSCG-928-F07]
MAHEQTTADKRQHGRLNRTFEVEVNELQFPIVRDKVVQTRCYDISEGGLSIESPDSFEAGAKLQVRINIPLLNKFSPSFFKVYENDADQYFMAIAEVMWCKPHEGVYLLGMRYVNVDDDQARALSAMINKAFRSDKA